MTLCWKFCFLVIIFSPLSSWALISYFLRVWEKLWDWLKKFAVFPMTMKQNFKFWRLGKGNFSKKYSVPSFPWNYYVLYNFLSLFFSSLSSAHFFFLAYVILFITVDICINILLCFTAGWEDLIVCSKFSYQRSPEIGPWSKVRKSSLNLLLVFTFLLQNVCWFSLDAFMWISSPLFFSNKCFFENIKMTCTGHAAVTGLVQSWDSRTLI